MDSGHRRWRAPALGFALTLGACGMATAGAIDTAGGTSGQSTSTTEQATTAASREELGVITSTAPTPTSTAPTTTSTPTTVPTTTVPPTTVPPTTSTTSPPPPPPPTTPSPPTSDPGTGDALTRIRAAFETGVPARWRSAVPVSLGLRSGTSSMSWPDGRLHMTHFHAGGDWDRLVAIVAHEFGHHIAFRYGTLATLGAAPAGWPVSGAIPVERWADCVARVFTGYPLGSHTQGACSGDSLEWTRQYLANGP